MQSSHRLLAVAVAVAWGLNFPAIHLSLAQFPPFLLVALRFALLAVPTVLLVRRPAVPWRWIVGYGAGFGVLQFLFLYLAMASGMPSGLASLVLQSAAPFTVVLAGVLLRERLSVRQGLGVAMSAAGLGGIAVHRAELGGGAMLLPFLLTICGGLGWALGNLCSRQARAVEPFRLTLWMTVVPPLPVLVASLALEGPARIRDSVTSLATGQGALAVAGLAYTVLVATIGGSGVWTWLMSRYPSSVVAPFSMLVPVAGMASSWLLLGEPMFAVELAFGVVVVAGVLLGSGSAAPVQRAAEPSPSTRPGGSWPHQFHHTAPAPERRRGRQPGEVADPSPLVSSRHQVQPFPPSRPGVVGMTTTVPTGATAATEPTASCTLGLGGMTCASCVSRVENALRRVDGVSAAEST